MKKLSSEIMYIKNGREVIKGNKPRGFKECKDVITPANPEFINIIRFVKDENNIVGTPGRPYDFTIMKGDKNAKVSFELNSEYKNMSDIQILSETNKNINFLEKIIETLKE